MINVSQRVNYFLLAAIHFFVDHFPSAGSTGCPTSAPRFSHLASLSAPRFRQRERGVILSTPHASCKRFREENPKERHQGRRSRGALGRKPLIGNGEGS
ncbi:hypothetical protein [Burkholderia glumae]|uniref:hypothetical protein n=1 Tax=Burkholderia glumae TaxID=337 RepID=UPI002151A712|nr:hypothetical protein [Burkholderia glumae]